MIYTYGCEEHGEFECSVALSEPDHKRRVNRCPVCGRESGRVYLPVGIAFKGPGFYVNDYGGNVSAPAKGANGKPN